MIRRRPPGAGTGLLLPVLLATAVLAAPVAPAAAEIPLFAPLSAGEELPLPPLDPEVPSPAAFLGYPLGERFTRYAGIRAYLDRLAAVSDRVAAWDYGATYEDRPLTLLAVSSAANLARLDAIRAQRARLADPTALSGREREELAGDAPAVVWLAYGVHGNESASSEAALATAYVLAAAADGSDAAGWLEHLVVLVDPLSNPDGRERYVGAYQQRRGRHPDPEPAALEHREPWPGGRSNHYLFDLNRDWSWATQRETRHRLRELAAWQPQVYVDLHEMGAEATYFFPPSAEPVNPEIDPRVVRWLDVFGRGNGTAFDRLGWLYYKAENFDLFYPGYADSYTSFRGAVGMTYEVGGGGRAGLVFRRPDGSVVTLADRAARHVVASLATVETAARHHRRLVSDYLDARVAQVRRSDAPTYLFSADHPEAAALAALLARHGVEVRRLEVAQELEARRLLPADPRDPARHDFPAGTWAVSAAQPQGNLVRALMEPDVPMSEGFVEQQRRRVEQDLDPGFYDVTAWSLPLAFNVEAWAATAAPRRLGPAVPPPSDATADADPPPVGRNGAVYGNAGVGWLIPPAGLAAYRAAARLQRAGVLYRRALVDFAVGGRTHPAGTLFVPRRGAPGDAGAVLAEIAAGGGLQIHGVATSYSEEGISLGSARMTSVVPARVGLVAGDGTFPTAVGALWHLLDRQVELPCTLLDGQALDRLDLAAFDVLVLPDGWRWNDLLAGDAGDAVGRWIDDGGVLVAAGDGPASVLREKGWTAVAEWEPPESAAADPESPEALRSRPLDVPGAVVATELRPGHPLTLGLPSPPPVLVEGTRPLLATGEPQTDVLTVAAENPVIAGHAWPESEARLAGSLLVASEAKGEGTVVTFAQDPVHRGIWRGTAPLFLNAVMFAPSVEGGRY